MTRVKVCGHRRVEDVRASISAGVDAIGVISEVPVDTPRDVSPEQATDLLAEVGPLVSGVLVTMPETVERARELVKTVRPDAVQIHATLNPDQIADLAEAIPQSVLLALDVDADLEAYAQAADALVIDSLDEKGGGGTGQTHDWEKTATLVEDLSVPVILAGGLDPGNVASAVERVHPYGVDVASGVEREGGIKDSTAVEEFVERAKRARVTV